MKSFLMFLEDITSQREKLCVGVDVCKKSKVIQVIRHWKVIS